MAAVYLTSQYPSSVPHSAVRKDSTEHCQYLSKSLDAGVSAEALPQTSWSKQDFSPFRNSPHSLFVQASNYSNYSKLNLDYVLLGVLILIGFYLSRVEKSETAEEVSWVS